MFINNVFQMKPQACTQLFFRGGPRFSKLFERVVKSPKKCQKHTKNGKIVDEPGVDWANSAVDWER